MNLIFPNDFNKMNFSNYLCLLAVDLLSGGKHHQKAGLDALCLYGTVALAQQPLGAIALYTPWPVKINTMTFPTEWPCSPNMRSL